MSFDYPFYFMRHGETDWNLNKRTQGQLDSQLNETGRAQALRGAELLKDEPIERIVSSPLSRVRDTAMVVAAHHDVSVTFDDDLMECHLGDHQGEPHGPWLAQYWTGQYDPPNGESFAQFTDRVLAAMRRAVSLGPNTLIVAHGGLWIATCTRMAVKPEFRPVQNASPMHATPTENGLSVRRLADD